MWTTEDFAGIFAYCSADVVSLFKDKGFRRTCLAFTILLPLEMACHFTVAAGITSAFLLGAYGHFISFHLNKVTND